MDGCVDRRWCRRRDNHDHDRGEIIHIAAILSLASIVLTQGLAEIARSAHIIASASLVSSTAHASARYSRFLETANKRSGKKSEDKSVNHKPSKSIIILILPSFLDWFVYPVDESDDNDLSTSDPIQDIAPTKTVNIVIVKTSLLIMCVNSWAITASSCSLVRWLTSQRVRTIRDWWGIRPRANAFSASSSIIHNLGTGSQREIQSDSRITGTSRQSASVHILAPLRVKISCLWNKNHIHANRAMIGKTPRLIWANNWVTETSSLPPSTTTDHRAINHTTTHTSVGNASNKRTVLQ
jgi:hypothetical protein